jgi:hypothetical protein
MNILGLTITRERAPKTAARRSARAVALLVATSVVMTGGVAYAFWTTTGSGTGGAAAGSATALTFTPGTVNTNVLYPTGTGDVVITVTNPNPFVVQVDSLTLPATAATSFTNAGLTTPNSSCDTGGTGVTWSYATKSLSGVVVQKRVGSTNGTLTLTLTGGASMSNASDTTCQNAFFKMPNVTTAVVSSSTGTPVAAISQ